MGRLQSEKSLGPPCDDGIHGGGDGPGGVRLPGRADAGAWIGADAGEDRRSGNAILLRKGALSEIDSSISRDHAKIIALQPGIKRTLEGRPVAVSEIGLQLTLRKAKERSLASLSLRGTSHDAFAVRPKVRLAQGRLWEAGTTEIVVGTQVAKQFPEAGLHRVLHFGNREWTVVGVFDADGSGFDSEVWGDAEQFMATFHRTAFSSMTVGLARPDALVQVKEQLSGIRGSIFR